ncbi:hypothetical protein DFH08DRAFT_877943 [Mycena albidolilacea]|uniref:Uncharacterized protein n=1 Tax=Mycena albidolilacea TaxID=1033008 RepID=A0AAD6ZRC7_9AGAR|nr:hypothetical protein DFH08DRAFT_877943 [Mycena albidolilacea]
MLPPHPFFAPPFSLSPPSPFAAPRPVRRARLRSSPHTSLTTLPLRLFRPARFGVPSISARLGYRIFHMSLTTLLPPSSPSIIFDALTAALARRQHSVRSTAISIHDPRPHPWTRVCNATLRQLRAPHRAGTLTRYDSHRPPHARTRCSSAAFCLISPYQFYITA